MPDLRDNPIAALIADGIRREQRLQERCRNAVALVGLFVGPQQRIPYLKGQVAYCACGFGGDF